MNPDDRNRKWYQATFDEVHASENLLERIKNMDKKNRKHFVVRKLGYAAAVALAVILTSNAVTYAATGKSWVETMLVSINGVQQEVEVECTEDAAGNRSYEYTVDVDEDGDQKVVFSVWEDPAYQESVDIAFEVDTEPQVVLSDGDGKLYLEFSGQKIDITEDMKDGKCEGTFEFEGSTYRYHVEGDGDENNIVVEKVSASAEIETSEESK